MGAVIPGLLSAAVIQALTYLALGIAPWYALTAPFTFAGIVYPIGAAFRLVPANAPLIIAALLSGVAVFGL